MQSYLRKNDGSLSKLCCQHSRIKLAPGPRALTHLSPPPHVVQGVRSFSGGFGVLTAALGLCGRAPSLTDARKAGS